MSSRNNGAVTNTPRLSIAIFSKFPRNFIEGKVSKDLADLGVEVAAILEPGKPVPPCDVAGFMYEFGSRGDETLIRRACSKAGIKLVLLSRKSAVWRDAFRKAGVSLDRPKPILVHSQPVRVPTPIPTPIPSSVTTGATGRVLRSILASAPYAANAAPPTPDAQAGAVQQAQDVAPAVTPAPEPEPCEAGPESVRETILSREEYDEFIAMYEDELAEAKRQAAELEVRLSEAEARLQSQSGLADERQAELEECKHLVAALEDRLSAAQSAAPAEPAGTRVQAMMKAFDVLIVNGALSHAEAWSKVMAAFCEKASPPEATPPEAGEEPAPASRRSVRRPEAAIRAGVYEGQRWRGVAQEIIGRLIEVDLMTPTGVYPKLIEKNKPGSVRKHISYEALRSRYELVR